MEAANNTSIILNFNKLNTNLNFDVVDNTVDITYKLK